MDEQTTEQSPTQAEITIKLPGVDEPGFLRRIREFRAVVEESPGPAAMWEAIARYVVAHGYIEVPAGVDPLDAIGELPRSEMHRITRALSGDLSAAEAGTVNPPSGG